MNRKHFIRIAFILKENKASQKMIEEFAAYFYEENDNFDYHRFLNACFLNEEK